MSDALYRLGRRRIEEAMRHHTSPTTYVALVSNEPSGDEIAGSISFEPVGGLTIVEPPEERVLEVNQCWQKAVSEHGGDGDAVRARYRELMRENGHLVSGTPEPLSCGWQPGRDHAYTIGEGDPFDWTH